MLYGVQGVVEQLYFIFQDLRMSNLKIIVILVILTIGMAVAKPSIDQGSQQSAIQMSSSKPKGVFDTTHCDASEFACDNGNCIPSNRKCDNNNDCKDNSDELESHCSSLKNNSCVADEYRCEDGTCISTLWMCDEVDDCKNGEDEFNCTSNDPECSTNGNIVDDTFIGISFHFANAGCFPPGATERTLNGSISMDMLQLGMKILSLSQNGKLVLITTL